MTKKHRHILVCAGVAVGLVLLSVGVVGVPLSRVTRTEVLQKGVELANEHTGYDIDLGDLYLSPLHHSPMVLYHAYKGHTDLPLEVRVDSLFVGHRGQDTLIYTRCLRLKATLLTSQDADGFTAIPIVVERLLAQQTTFHSDSMIAAVGIDAIIGHLELNSPELIIAQGQYPLHNLRLYDSYVGIDLRETPPDTTAKDTTVTPMAFEVPNGEISHFRFVLMPLGMDIRTDTLALNVLADVGGNKYDVHRLDVGGMKLGIGTFTLPLDTIYGDACVDLERSLITSNGLHTLCDEMGAEAHLSATKMSLETMRVDVVGDADFKGSKARLRGYYDIDDESYDMHVDVDKVDLAALMNNHTRAVIAGQIDAKGKGIDPTSRAMRTQLKVNLRDAIYDNIEVSGMRLDAQLADGTVTGDLHLPFAMTGDSMQIAAQTEHQFRVARFMTPDNIAVDYDAQVRQLRTQVAGQRLKADKLLLHFDTDTTTSLALNTEGLDLTAGSPMHVMTLINRLQPLLKAVSDSTVMQPITSLSDLSMLDTLRPLIPPLRADIRLRQGSPAQPFIDDTGLDIDQLNLTLNSDSLRTDLAFDAAIPTIGETNAKANTLRLPPAKASLNVAMTDGRTNASLTADSRLTDGAMGFYGLCTDAGVRMDLERKGRELYGNGQLTLDSINYNNTDLGNHTIDMRIAPSDEYAHAIRAEVETEAIPLDIVEGFVELPDIALRGAVRAAASVDGLPAKTDISAEVHPLNISARYKPYDVGFSLGETPIIMSHNHVDLNGLPVYGADSTFIALTGGLDLDSMRMDVTLTADSFAPVKLPQGGPIPVYGELATDIRGRVTGPLDSIVADIDVTLLPTTDITYPIDQKNLAQVKPYGMVNVKYQMAESEPLTLDGRINVDDGFVRYSPKIYPIMPFRVDSGSNVAFNGPIGKTRLNISASQKVKADVESEEEETRRVDFTTGVRVNGELDSIGLKSIGFFLEAPEDETITRELASVDEETREGLAATLLATGMYVGESNVAAQRDGYALSSIINSRLNAAMANSKLGKIVDIDISSAQTEHAAGKTNDMNIAISKSFFKDKLRVTIGSTLTDNPEVNTSNGLFTSLTADYKLTKDGNVLLRLFSQRDYNNILEGELYKSGLGVRALKDWKRQELFRGDSITRTYSLTADAGVAYRSNNSIGPDLTLKTSIRNLMGRGESFTIKGNGAYCWALRGRRPGNPRKTDTYKLGLKTTLMATRVTCSAISTRT